MRFLIEIMFILKASLIKNHMINRILHPWSFYMKYMKLAEPSEQDSLHQFIFFYLLFFICLFAFFAFFSYIRFLPFASFSFICSCLYIYSSSALNSSILPIITVGAVKTAFDIQVNGKLGPGRPKMT